MKNQEIVTYKEFNDYYNFNGSNVRSKNSDFHIFRFSEIGPTSSKMGPFKIGYYQFAIGNKLEANVSVFDTNKTFLIQDYSIIIFKPGQVIEWTKTGEWDGFVINVKESFLNMASTNNVLKPEYQFIYDHKALIYHIKRESYLELSYFYELIYKESISLTNESIHVIKSLLQVLLTYMKRIINSETSDLNDTYTNVFLNLQYLDNASKFKSLIIKNYLISKSVSYYANQLNITGAFLNKCTKIAYDKTAKDVIYDILLLHSKTMLENSDLGIKEIAFQLNFDDYSHFVKFFKSKVGVPPAAYKKKLSKEV